MGRLIALMAGVLVGALCMYFGFNYHIVVSEKTLFVPKKHTQLADMYVDIRDWGVAEWSQHPHLADAMIAAGHGNLVAQSVQRGLIEDLFHKIGGREPARN